MKNQLRVGIAQINPIVGDYAYNSRKIIRMISEAQAKSLDWVIFSELSLSGYPVWDLANKRSFVSAGLKFLDKVVASTRGKRILVMLGFIDRGPEGSGKSFNALAVLQDGKVLHKQYKTLLPTYDVFLEQIYFEPAREQKIFRYGNLPVGLSICEDIWDEQYSVKPTRILARKGARVIVNISASPYHARVAGVRDRLIRAKARETKAHFIYVNQVGGQDDLIFDGRSLVANPRGEILFRGAAFREHFSEVTLDLSGRGSSLVYSPVQLLHPRLGCGNREEVYAALEVGVRDYVQKNGFKRVVLGLSGGIDSALTAAVAADALGPQSVIGVAMPGEFSSLASFADARELARNLGIEFRVRPITRKYRLFLSDVARSKKREGKEALERKKISLAMENLQARLRGLELMYISNDESALLVSTGNKSELATGYCTLYGDMSGGLCVLGDVYKTDVYRLADYRNSLRSVIPRSTIEKAPTAELRPNQKDQDSLPPYEILDEILYRYIEENKGRDEIMSEIKSRKVAARLVEDIINRVDHNEYKRRQAPPILRVSEKAWFGRRMPITNHFRG